MLRHGILPFAIKCYQDKRALIVAKQNVKEVALLDKLLIYYAHNLQQVVMHLSKAQLLQKSKVICEPSASLCNAKIS